MQGTALPPTECSDATASLLVGTDQCSGAIRALLSGNENALVGLYNGDCPMRFLNYTTVCSDYFGDDDEVSNIIP